MQPCWYSTIRFFRVPGFGGLSRDDRPPTAGGPDASVYQVVLTRLRLRYGSGGRGSRPSIFNRAIWFCAVSCTAVACVVFAAENTEIAEFDRLITAGNYEQAAVLLEEFIAENPRSWEGLYQLGYVYFRLHRIWPSIRLLSKSLSINVENAEAHKILGMDFTIVNRLDLAKKELELAVQLNPKSAESHYALGRVQYEQGAYGRAVTSFQKAIVLAPDYVKAYHNLGLAYEATSQLSFAKDSFVRAIELNEEQAHPSAWPYINFGAFHNRRGDFEDALKLLESAVAHDPHAEEAHFQQAKAYRGLGRWAECVQSLQRAIAIDDQVPEFHYVLSAVYRRLGKHTDSNVALETFRRLNSEPDQPSFRRRVGPLQ